MTTRDDMDNFEAFLDKFDDSVNVGSSPSALKGIGIEYIVENGIVVSKFLDGKQYFSIKTED